MLQAQQSSNATNAQSWRADKAGRHIIHTVQTLPAVKPEASIHPNMRTMSSHVSRRIHTWAYTCHLSFVRSRNAFAFSINRVWVSPIDQNPNPSGEHTQQSELGRSHNVVAFSIKCEGRTIDQDANTSGEHTWSAPDIVTRIHPHTHTCKRGSTRAAVGSYTLLCSTTRQLTPRRQCGSLQCRHARPTTRRSTSDKMRTRGTHVTNA